jgi:hypothetical protein
LLGIEGGGAERQQTSVTTDGAVASAAFVDLGALKAAHSPTERFELRLDLGGGLLLHLVRG